MQIYCCEMTQMKKGRTEEIDNIRVAKFVLYVQHFLSSFSVPRSAIVNPPPEMYKKMLFILDISALSEKVSKKYFC